MKVIDYIRVSTDKQNGEKQGHLLFQHAQRHKLQIDRFISVEMSSRKSNRERRFDELPANMNAGDVLLVAELSRLGRILIEVIDILNQLGENGVEVVFVRQPELSTTGAQRKLLLANYSYFAETEREFISLRTRQGPAAARAKGKNLRRPKGSRDKFRVLDPYRTTIREHLRMRGPLRRIWQIVNTQLAKPISYNAYCYFVRQDPELLALWEAQYCTSLALTPLVDRNGYYHEIANLLRYSGAYLCR